MKRKTRQYIEISIVFFIISLIVSSTPGLISLGKNIPIKMMLMILPYIIMVGFVVSVCRVSRKSLSTALGFNKDNIGKQLLIALVIFVVITFVFVVVPLLLGMGKTDVLRYKITKASTIGFYIIYYMVFVGVGEEIVFRGYFYEIIKNTTSSGVCAVVISSILFGLFHYPVGHNIIQVLITTVIGLILAGSRLKIKDCSTLSVGIAHGLYGTFILILSCVLL